MQTQILTSTALLALLLSVGLFFFIRASAKDRTQIARLVAEQPEDSLLETLYQYFTQRAYRIATVNAEENQVTFEGIVRPSVFLAVFLTLLAATGLLCVTLMLTVLFPDVAQLLPLLVLLAPVAGVFYWQNAKRPEQVSLQLEQIGDYAPTQQVLTVTAHRDELAELQRSLNLRALD